MIFNDIPFLNSIRDPLIILDTDFNIRYINKNGAAVYGHKHDDLIGKKCFEQFQNSASPCVICPIEPVFALEKTHISQKWVTLPKGGRRCGEVRSYPVFDETNTIIAVTSIIVDITEKKDPHPAKADPNPSIKFNLSRRETQILDLISKGYTNPDISDTLCISINTVKSHIVHIFNKTGVSDRTQAAIIALKSNLI